MNWHSPGLFVSGMLVFGMGMNAAHSYASPRPTCTRRTSGHARWATSRRVRWWAPW